MLRIFVTRVTISACIFLKKIECQFKILNSSKNVLDVHPINVRNFNPYIYFNMCKNEKYQYLQLVNNANFETSKILFGLSLYWVRFLKYYKLMICQYVTAYGKSYCCLVPFSTHQRPHDLRHRIQKIFFQNVPLIPP
jgi:hypothetical protein